MDSDSVSLSVLVPLYNERYLIKTTLTRLLSVRSRSISSMEIIVVDDASTDGSHECVQEFIRDKPGVRLYRHPSNRGKGAAIRTALQYAAGDICIVQDADTEYNPEDIPRIIEPFITEGADAVFGSRYMSSSYRRVLMYWHSLMNKKITQLINWLTDLDLSDVETCYKAVKTRLLKSIPIRSNDFRFEVEIAMKLAKRRARIFEVPVRYLPRSYEEGKKIRARDGFLALLAILKYSLFEDLYKREHYGLKILRNMNNARQFNKWMGDTLRPYVGEKILEIGAGIGTLTGQFIPRERYVASDVSRHALEFLANYAFGKHYLEVAKIDAEKAEDFAPYRGEFDTVLMLNVLEHVSDPSKVLANLRSALREGTGRLVVLVPQHPALYGSFDRHLKHRERYTEKKLRGELEENGFAVEKIFDFNRFTVPSWYINGRLLRRKRFSLFQLKLLEIVMPVVRRIDPLLPWGGLSLIAVARRK